MQALPQQTIEEPNFGARLKISSLKRKRFAQTPPAPPPSLKKSIDEDDFEELNMLPPPLLPQLPSFEEPPQQQQVNEFDDDNDDDVDSDEEASNHSSTSTVSTSSGGACVRLNKVKHGHKMLITEEKMTNALRDLHFSSSQAYNNNSSSSSTTLTNASMATKYDVDFSYPNGEDPDKEDDDNDELQNDEFRLSDELKSKLKEYNRNAYLFNQNASVSNVANVNIHDNKTALENQQMQLVLWSPRVELISSSKPSNEDDDDDEGSRSSSDDSEMTSYENNIINNRHSSSSESSASTSSSKSITSNDPILLVHSETYQMEGTSAIPPHTTSPLLLSPLSLASTPYRVEEPSLVYGDSSSGNSNKLKRKYSQLNKINIEEVTEDNTTEPIQPPPPSFYLVDQSSDLTDQSTDLAYLNALSGRTSDSLSPSTTTNANGRVIITEIISEDDGDDHKDAESIFKKKAGAGDQETGDQEMEF